MILDHMRTRFLGGRLIRESDLYASIYGKLQEHWIAYMQRQINFAMDYKQAEGNI